MMPSQQQYSTQLFQNVPKKGSISGVSQGNKKLKNSQANQQESKVVVSSKNLKSKSTNAGGTNPGAAASKKSHIIN
jgi:hypothetical protein